MALTLAQSAVISTNQLSKAVQIFVQQNPILDRIPLMTIRATRSPTNEETDAAGVAFRGVNGVTPNRRAPSTRRLRGWSSSVVTPTSTGSFSKPRSNLANQRAEQTKLKVKALVQVLRPLLQR